MSIPQEPKKTLEVKIRPFSTSSNQERPDQKGASRVHLCSEALRELGLSAGELCYLWRGDETPERKREAVVWPTLEKSLSKKVVQMSKTFQEATGFKLADDLKICSSESPIVQTAEVIILRDITGGYAGTVPQLTDEEILHWEWFLKENLSRAEVVFAGMIFKNISLRGPKRSFVIDLVNRKPTGLGTFNESSSVVKISSLDPEQPSATSEPLPKLEVVNIAGIDQALRSLNEFLGEFDKSFHYKWAQRSCAALLHGGHGTGKTFILEKVVKTGWAKCVIHIDGDAKPDIIRTVFKNAKLTQPSIIVIDDMDDLLGKDNPMSKKITKVLEDELDKLSKTFSGESLPRVVVLASTLDISLVPLTLRKVGRFWTDVALPIPDTTARRAILKSLAPPVDPETSDAILNRLGDITHAYTAEDLVSLLTRACLIAEKNIKVDIIDGVHETFHLSQDDLEQALLRVRPTAMHDITLAPPSVRWDEIGGQDSIKKALRLAVETPMIRHERVKRIGGSPTKGILLYGPPGCSKTLSAQAMATEIGFNFFAVKGAELLNMYVGESERAVRNIFARARAASPSIIFFDEIESIASKRESSGRNNGINVLTTLLNEMDGIETLKGVTVLAATNQPQALDIALLRPGRFDKLLYVAPPDLKGREEILLVKKRKMDFADDVDIPEIARLTDGYSGAELVGICQTACDVVLEKCENTGEELQIHMEDFLDAVKQVKKQITPELVWGYERWASGIRGK